MGINSLQDAEKKKKMAELRNLLHFEGGKLSFFSAADLEQNLTQHHYNVSRAFASLKSQFPSTPSSLKRKQTDFFKLGPYGHYFTTTTTKTTTTNNTTTNKNNSSTMSTKKPRMHYDLVVKNEQQPTYLQAAWGSMNKPVSNTTNKSQSSTNKGQSSTNKPSEVIVLEEEEREAAAPNEGKVSSLAQQQIEKVLNNNLKGRLPPENWLMELCDGTLGVVSNRVIFKLVDDVVDYIVRTEKQLCKTKKNTNINSTKQQAVEAIIQLLLLLPSKIQQEIGSRRMIPTDDDLKSFDSTIANTKLENSSRDDAIKSRSTSSNNSNQNSSKNIVEQLKVERGISKKANPVDSLAKLIGALSNGCHAYLERLKWCHESINEMTSKTAAVKEILSTLNKEKIQGQLLNKAESQLSVCKGELTNLISKKKSVSQDLHKCIMQRKEEILSGKKFNQPENADDIDEEDYVGVENENIDEETAYMQAVEENMKSFDPNVVELRDLRNQLDLQLLNKKHEVVFWTLQMKLAGAVTKLFEKVEATRLESLEAARLKLLQKQMSSFELARESLFDYVPLLCKLLADFHSVHSLKIQKAQHMMDSLADKLSDHLDTFGDSVPSTQHDIEVSIREYNNVVNNSYREMTSKIQEQTKLWLTTLVDKETIVPLEIKTMIVQNFQLLRTSLTGPMKSELENLLAGSYDSSGIEEKENLNNEASSMEGSISAMIQQNEEEKFQIKLERMEESLEKPVTAKTEETEKCNEIIEKNDKDQIAATSNVSPNAYSIEKVLYTKFSVGNQVEFYRGRVKEILTDGTYKMLYDDGDTFAVEARYLFTEDEMKELLASEEKARQDRTPKSNEEDSKNSCCIM